MNITLPASTAEELRRSVPERQRARFIADALMRELRRLRVEEGLKVSAGAWKTEDHPELLDATAIDRWVESGRSELDRALDA